MTVILKAKAAADRVYTSIRAGVAERQAGGVRPCMATLLVEGDPASAYYAQAKRKVADKLGVDFQLHTFPSDVSEEEMFQRITQLNEDPAVHGIMLELPLPGHLSTTGIAGSIAPFKDVDGITPSNKWATVTGEAGLYPATPMACIRLLRHYGYALEGRNVTLVGRGQTVGLPLFHMLQREQATVTVCHSRTPDIASHLAHAEIGIVAVGRPKMITRSMVHAKLVLIDAGINETEDGNIVGDVDPEANRDVAAYSPVPGGVGTLTTAILFENLLKAMELQKKGAMGR